MAFKLVWDKLGYRLLLNASSEAVGFEAQNLEDGSRRTYWRATGTGEQTLTYDAGAGKTEEADTTVLVRADLLVAVGASVVTQWSNDGATGWTDAYTAKAPLVAGDLQKPTDDDAYVEHSSLLAKRAWRLRLYGTMSAAPSLAGLWIGKRLELQKPPLYGGDYGRARPDRGADLTLTFQRFHEAGMDALLTALHAVTPGFPAEAPQETTSGAVYGGRPHFLYDTLGEAFRFGLAGAPALLNVILMSPEALQPVLEFHRVWTLGPLRWRTLV
jgi:hypothetical protein